MNGKNFWLATTSLTAALLLASTAFAEKAPPAASGPSNAELEQRIEKLEQKVQQTNDQNSALRTRLSTVEQGVADPVWSYANGRPTITSGDGRFSLSLRTRFQFDFADFIQKRNLPAAVSARDLSSGAVIRRAYLGIEGRAFKDFWYEFRMNFGGTTAEGQVNGDTNMNLARIAYVGIPNFRINAGIIQPIFTLDDTVSSGQIMFIERAEINNLATDSFGGADARRGIEMTFQKQDFLHAGDNFLLSGAFTGNKTGDATGHGPGGDEASQVLGRAAYRLWSDGFSNVQLGVSAAQITHFTPTLGAFTLQDRPEIRVDGTRLISTGALAAKTGSSIIGADAAFNLQNFYVGGEYYKINVERPAGGNPNFSGWYVAGSWVLTGEVKPYNVSAMNNGNRDLGARPASAGRLSLSGNSWGAWELAARYSDTDLNWNEGTLGLATPAGGVRGGEEKIVTLGLNWYLNNNVRMVLDDMIVKVDRINTAGAFGQIGQNMNVIGYRLQFQM